MRDREQARVREGERGERGEREGEIKAVRKE
jgi:hypothetical protein